MGWDPFEEMREIERRMNRLLREMWGPRPSRRLLERGEKGLAPMEAREPYTDIMETTDSVIVTAELPGVKKEDISINAAEESIEISAEIKREAKVEEKGFYRRERGYDRYYRAYSLPARVKPDEAKATYKNGVLEIVLPKTEAKEKGRSVRID